MRKQNRGLLFILIGAIFVVLIGVYLTFFGTGIGVSPLLDRRPKPLRLPEITPFPPLEEQPVTFKPQFGKMDQRPSEVAVYKVTSQKHSVGMARLWANKFGFPGDFSEDTGSEYLWFREGALFGYNYLRGSMRFEAAYSFKGAALGFGENFYASKAIERAKNLSLFGETLDVRTYAVNFYSLSKGGEGVVSVDSSEAEFVEVELTPYLSSYPIVYDTEPYSLTQVQLSLAGELIGLSHRFFSLGENLGDYPLKTESQSQATLNFQAKIVGLFCEGCGLDWGELKQNITVNQFEGVAYLFSSDQEVLQPIFIFRGTGEFEEGKAFQARVYLPAIDPTLLR